VSYRVLTPVERRRLRRRRQVRRRRVIALVLLAVLAGAVGWFLRPHSDTAPAAAARSQPATPHAPSHRLRKHVVALLGGGAPRLQAHRFTPALAARAAILVDADDGTVLWQLRPHERRPVASTTKIMTALLALERLGPHAVVTVDRSVPRVPLVREGLRAGERVEAWKLFYGMMLYSGNDDALALAIASAGSRPAFVKLMNAKARELALHDTHFRSPSGVEDEDNYSTVWDLAALTRVALQDKRFRAIVRTHRIHVPWSAPTYEKIYVNHNLLVGSYPGANGVKTGYTSKAGHCLVASATRRGRTLVAVVLDSPNMYVDAKRLLTLGFRDRV
jgi:D-alanyl-D-alanine carboxypeptidase (penicillin-binding protein 5/6)